MDIRSPFYSEAPTIALGIEYNEDGSAFAIGTDTGFKIFDSATGKLIYDRELQGSISFASVLSNSRLVGLIGGGIGPHYPPNKFVFWDDSSKSEPFKIEYNERPIRACLSKSRYVVVFERGIIMYKLDPDSESNDSVSRIATYETAPNPLGLCCLGQTKLAFPGRTEGHAQVVDLASKKVSILPAHKSALSALALSKDEKMIATASKIGTLFRIWSTSMEARLFEFRRGNDSANIFSISFSPSGALMAITSGNGTLHIFEIESDNKLDRNTASRSSRPNSSSSSSNAVPVPSKRRPLSGTAACSSPKSPIYATSPTTGSNRKYKLGTSPTDRTSLTPSDYSSAHIPSSSHSVGKNWNDLARQQPQPSYSGRSASLNSDSTGDFITSADLEGYKPAKKYQSIVDYIPSMLAPELLLATYSTCHCPFEIGNEPKSLSSKGNTSKSKTYSDDRAAFDTTGSVSSIRSGSTIRASETVRQSAWWPEGRPPKGKIAWIDDETLVVVSAGADARWEIFVVGRDREGKKGVERRGYRRILEDEGID